MFDLSKCKRDADGNYIAQTRDGRPVTLITTRGRKPWPYVGYVGEERFISVWPSDGVWDQDKPGWAGNLINVPEPKRSGEVQFAVCADGTIVFAASGVPFSLKGVAGKEVLAIKRVPWTEGEGLEGK